MGRMKRVLEDSAKAGADTLHLGVDAGSVSVNAMVINGRQEVVYEAPYVRHFGQVEERVLELLRELEQRFGARAIQSVSFTGNHGKELGRRLGCFHEFDTISQVLGVLAVQPEARTIISMGGQDTAIFQISQRDGGWGLEYFNTNGPCASGTGSFIDQQAQRLATSLYSSGSDAAGVDIGRILEDFIRLGTRSETPANVACRCTVFTKSDMIHLQNKGERLEDIIYGLHVGNARNYMSTIVANRRLDPPIVFVGGLTLNALQVKAFREYFPDLIVPAHSTSLGALGVALQALEQGRQDRVDLSLLEGAGAVDRLAVPVAPRLVLKKTRFPEHNRIDACSGVPGTRVYLGLDIGSTTTKYALINEQRKILHKSYVPTQGKPIEVTQRLLATVQKELTGGIELVGTATTGSGRNVVGDFLNADLVIDEITAHARGAVEIDPEVDTIFEIGGQDSKYISIVNSHPLDFDMNKVCAAGTGSFLHELANKHGINIVGEFQAIALSSAGPVKLAERCTVFMESDLVSYFQKGVAREDLVAGLCYAIVHNYLNRVVGKRSIGRRVMFLGGPSLNQGVVAAFENVLGRGLTVPRHREVLGAFGAAISVQEKMAREGRRRSTFRGLRSAIEDRMSHVEKTCRADADCHNQCKLKIYDFDGRRSVWGGECGRYELTRSRGSRKENYFALRQQIWERHLAGTYRQLGGAALPEADGRPTVGMQRALYGLQGTVLWAHFFDRLGMRLVLTPFTNTEISRTGIENTVAETCYPVKVSHGHIRMLLGKTRYLFLPSLINMPTPNPAEVGFYCPMVQSNAYMASMALGIDRSRVLSPIVHLKYEPEVLALELWDQLRSRIGKSRRQVREALEAGLDAQRQFVAELHERGREILAAADPGTPLVVVSGRPYNLYDERLNLRLGRNLAKIGVAALPMDFIDVAGVDLSDFPSMYWGLGAQILRTARLVQQHEGFFGLHLTNFSCGPDSFIEHFFKYVMGEKPYLILELDEHSAVAGAMTRLEAFRNVIENAMQEPRRAQAGSPRQAVC